LDAYRFALFDIYQENSEMFCDKISKKIEKHNDFKMFRLIIFSDSLVYKSTYG